MMRRAIVRIMAAALSLPVLGFQRDHPVVPPGPSAEELYSLGESYLDALGEEFDPDKALAALQDAIRLRPDYAEAYRKLGEAYYWRRGREHPADDEGSGAGSRVMGIGHPKAEIDAYEQAIALNPRFADAYVSLGETFVQSPFYPPSCTGWIRSLPTLRPFSPLTRAEREATEQAERLFLQALDADPRCTKAYYDLAVIYYFRGKYNRCLQQYWRAVAIDPSFPYAHRALLNGIAEQRHLEDAVAIYTEAIRLEPGFPGTFVALGDLYLGVANYRSAADALDQAIGLDSGYAVYAHERLAEADLAMGNYADASREGLYLARWAEAPTVLPETEVSFLERYFEKQKASEILLRAQR